MPDDLLALAHTFAEAGEPFALATVVRCDRPTSAKPGAKALVRRDGTVSGWIGGSCAEPVVVREALRALADGQPRLLALVGEGGAAFGAREGVLEYPMTCHSGGTLEIFVEPVLPRPQVVLVGRGPVAETLVRLCGAMDFNVTLVPSEEAADRVPHLGITARTFVVIVTHGTSDEDALEQALRTDAAYVSLVASRKRAAAVAEALRARGVPAERLNRLKAPAGLDLGAVTPAEIAASILAEIVQVSHAGRERPAADAEVRPNDAAEATDPICGMSVEVASAKYRSDALGRTFYFCCARCKRKFDEDPARYAGSRAG